MKSTLIYLTFLLFSGSVFCQTANNEETNSPGEKTQVNKTNSTNSNPSSVEEKHYAIVQEIQTNNTKIESLYFKDEEVYAAYGGGTEIITREYKKHIYKAGQTLIESSQSKLDQLSPSNYDERLPLLKEINKAQNQLLYFIKIDKTRSIEKKLKKLKTPEDIYPVFFAEF
ncbi:hypothetical protein [Ekhidna sp.]|uniref:hypothetical protein n=1 Tax=Ekhidna sp. TaxID=2608089 RepID=UPI0032EE27E1